MTQPAGGIIEIKEGRLQVPEQPVIPFVEGDGTGPDIWRASVRVFDAAVAKAYAGKRKIVWHEVLAGETAFKQTGNWLPDETVADFRKYKSLLPHYRSRSRPDQLAYRTDRLPAL